MPPIIREGMIQDLLDFIQDAFPIYRASLDILELILESDDISSDVAKPYRRWIHINLMQQLLPLKERERYDWIMEIFSGERNTAELFAGKMREYGFWTENKDEDGYVHYTMDPHKGINLRDWLLLPDIQAIYDSEVMQALPLILKDSIEGSDFVPKKGPKSAYKVVIPDWQQEFIATKQQLVQSQSLVADLQEEVRLANEVIATQTKALENKEKQLKVARPVRGRRRRR